MKRAIALVAIILAAAIVFTQQPRPQRIAAQEITPEPVAVATAAPVPTVIAYAIPTPATVYSGRAASDVLGAPRELTGNAAPYAAYIHVPPKPPAGKPLQVVIALHGMNGEGKGFAGSLLKAADQHNWVLVAPTIDYGNWHDPEGVAKEDVVIAERLNATIQHLAGVTGLPLKSRVKVFGFSRGAQVAHRFALSYPEDVSVVVAYSAGTYTLPLTAIKLGAEAKAEQLPFPYGISNLSALLGHQIDFAQFRAVRFMVGVGANDNKPGDVPRQWDEYLGATRVKRAEEFSKVLKEAGTNCTLKVFPGVGHEITNDMLTQAEQFFAADEQPGDGAGGS